MVIVIDTSVLVGLERRGATLEDLTTVAPDDAVAIASITASELLVGAYRADSGQRRQEREAFIEDILGRLPAFPFDLTVARVHAVLWAQLVSAGQLIGAHDLIIAATAVANGYAVLSENLRDFQRVPGLEVRQPAW